MAGVMSTSPDAQLPLRIGLRDTATFENYHPGANAGVLQAVRSGTEPCIYLWGAPGTGKTHLLQAACHQAQAGGETCAYLPGTELPALGPELLDGLEQLALVCLDDVQALAGAALWERALFDLYNRCRDAGTRLMLAGARAPVGLGIRLPDLVSRLGWGPVFQLHSLSDEDKVEALRQRAVARGLELPDEVARYLLQRSARDTHSLFRLLEQLDRASLAAQRKLTIPFVRELIRS